MFLKPPPGIDQAAALAAPSVPAPQARAANWMSAMIGSE